MTRYAEVEGVGTLEFPDDTTDEVIASTVQQYAQQAGAPDSSQPPPEAPPAVPSTTPAQPAQSVAERIAGRAAELGSAAIRPPLKAAAQALLLPLDAITGVQNFIRQGDYSPGAFARGVNPFAPHGAGDTLLPSERFANMLDAHTIAPTTPVGKGAELMSTMLLGSKTPGMPRPVARPGVNPSLGDQAIAAGQRHNVPVYFDDVTGNPIAKKLGVGAENVPVVGTSSGRATQAQAAKDAATRLTNRFADQIDEEVPVLIQESMQRRLNQFRGSADRLYARAAQLLDSHGDVNSSRFDSAINHELARQERLGTAANQRAVEILAKYDHAPRGNFSLMRDLRSQLSAEIRDFYTGGENRAIGERGVERLVEMRKALEADMSDFARRAGGEAERSWRTADSFYRTNLVPFKQQGFADLVRTAEPEKAWRYLVAQGGIESRGARMYNSLDESGRAAIRAGMLQEAMDTAVTAKGNFSPAKFAKYMEDRETIVDQFFRGSDRAEIKGFTNLMRHVDRAGQYMENPPTGQRLVGALMLGSAALAPKAMAVGAAAAGATRVMFQTERGRDLLLAASKLKPGSPAMSVLNNRIAKLMASGAATTVFIPQGEAPDAVAE